MIEVIYKQRATCDKCHRSIEYETNEQGSIPDFWSVPLFHGFPMGTICPPCHIEDCRETGKILDVKSLNENAGMDMEKYWEGKPSGH